MMKDAFPKFSGAGTSLPTHKHGIIKVFSEYFSGAIDGDVVVFFGAPQSIECPLVRIHSECVFAEVFDSKLCDCKEQLNLVFQRFKIEKHGILFYLRVDGRGEGLSAKVKATDLEVRGIDTFESRVTIGVEPESRSFDEIANYLIINGYRKIRLLSNNPKKIQSMQNAGIDVTQEPLIIHSENPEIRRLYATKAKRFHHIIPDQYFVSDKANPEQLSLELIQALDNS